MQVWKLGSRPVPSRGRAAHPHLRLPSRAGVSAEVRPAAGGQSPGGAVTVPGSSHDQEAGDSLWGFSQVGCGRSHARAWDPARGHRVHRTGEQSAVSEGGAPSPGPADPDAGARGGCPLIPGGPLFSSPAQTARTGCVLRGPFKRVVRIQGEEQEFFGKFKRTLYIVRDPT